MFDPRLRRALRGPAAPACAVAIAAFGIATAVLAGGVSFTQFTSINTGGDTNPTWSPDGTNVYYVSSSGGNPHVFYKAPGAAANSPGTRVTSWLNDELSISCSGDGWAVLTTRDSLNSVHLFRVPATGGAPLTKMTYGPYEDLHAAWWGSGGGSVVAFATDRGGAGHQIWTLVPNGLQAATQLQQVTGAGFDDLFPSWTPDGQSIVFSSNRGGVSQIYIVHRSGAGWGIPIALSSGGTARSNPEVSPSGDWIAYSQATSGTSLWIMTINGASQQMVSGSGSYEGEPVWSPDNNALAFVSNRSGASYVWLAHDLITPAQPMSWGRMKNQYR